MIAVSYKAAAWVLPRGFAQEQSVLYMLPPDVQNLIFAKLEAETEAMTRCLRVIAEGADDQLGFIAEEQIKLDLAAEQLWDSDY